MKTLLLLLFAGCAFGQVAQPVRFVTSDPAGACVNGTAMQYNFISGNLWGCKSAVWTLVSGGAGGITALTGDVTASGVGSVAATLVKCNTNCTASQAMVTDASKNVASLAYGTTSSATSLAERDADQNAFANNFISKSQSTASAGTTTNLGAGDARYQILTGTLNQTYKLPNANTLQLGASWTFNNNSTGVLTVTNQPGTTVATVPTLSSAQVIATTVGTSAGVWDVHFLLPGAFPISNAEGNTTKMQLFSGADPATDDCAKFDVNHNLVTAGAACGSGGTGTVTNIGTTSPITGGPITTTGTIACAACVTSTTPGVGIAHFAGGTQNVTSSAVSLTADVTGVLPSANSQPHSISFTYDGGGAVLTAGQKLLGQIGNLGASGCAITGWSLTADQSGSISIDLDAHSSSAPNAVPSVPNTTTDKISASAPMVLSTAQTASGGSTQVSTWTTSRAAWDTFAINVTGTPTSVTRVSGTVWCQ